MRATAEVLGLDGVLEPEIEVPFLDQLLSKQCAAPTHAIPPCSHQLGSNGRPLVAVNAP